MAATALVVSPLVVASGAFAADTTPTSLLSVNFEDGTKGALTQSGAAGNVVDDGTGNKVYEIDNRTASYDGLETPATLLDGLATGTKVHVSMKARLVADGSYSARWVKKPGYSWVSSNTALSASSWTTIDGTYTVGDGDTGVTFYTGTGADSGDTFSYQLDDISVVADVASTTPTTQTIVSADFDDSSLGALQQSGSPTLGYVDNGTGKALSVTGRANTWDSVQSATGILSAGVQYTFSAKVKLLDDVASSVGRFTVYDGSYTPVGGQAVSASDWTTIGGTYTLPDGVDPTTVKFALEAGPWDGSAKPGFLLDDVLVTAPGEGSGGGSGITIPAGFVPGGAIDPVATPTYKARGTDKTVALTFDDGPNGATTEDLLGFLADKGIHATFCVIGQNVTASGGAAVLRDIVAGGNALCNHSTDYSEVNTLTDQQIADRLMQNMGTIRTALGDPNAQVPFYRAPDGVWGSSAGIAVQLGEQPLDVRNLINDWDGASNAGDEAALTDALYSTITSHPGEIVLVHDGGGVRTAGIAAVKTVVNRLIDEGWTFTLPQGGPAGGSNGGVCSYPSGTAIDTDFEDGTLQGWSGRDDGHGTATLTVTDGVGHDGGKAVVVSDRVSQGQGMGRDVTCTLQAGQTYELTGWARFADGQPTDDVDLSYAQTKAGSTTYSQFGAFTGVTNTGWTQIKQKFTVPASDSLYLYFETKWANGAAGNTSNLLLDDITVTQVVANVQDITPIKDTLDFPMGAAVSSAQLVGAAGKLLGKHFDQVTPENTMKPEGWYNADHSFKDTNADADTLMQFAQDNDLRVYGHTLVWYQQTPDWFFQDSDGNFLTSSDADKQIMRDRLKTHIDNVAKYLSDKYGKFGSDTNPLVSFDVVNEVVSDNAGDPEGLRQSHWYQILGEEYIEDAFNEANAAFNGTYAADGVDHPIQLFINDYNTEQTGKRGRLLDLVNRLIADDVPVDGVGHQFHVTMSTPISTLKDAIDGFNGIQTADGHELFQAITELDVPTGTPVTEANLIDQGYYYKGIFDMLRAEKADGANIFSATVWGLLDGQSWRASSGAPLLFDDSLQAKYAYYGVTDQDLPGQVRSAIVFQGDVTGADQTSSVEWSKLPLHAIGDHAGFQLRWAADSLTAYVTVDDSTADATDAVTFSYGSGQTATVKRDGTVTGTGVTAQVSSTSSGWKVVAHLPESPALSRGGSAQFDAAVTDGSTTTGWNTAGSLGTLQLIEPLSYTEIPEAATAPTIDGVQDSVWDSASTVTTSTLISGAADGAKAKVYQLWKDNYLYVLADVTDPTVDSTSPNAYERDSVEIFTDPGNAKNGSYRPDDMQLRIGANGDVSYGGGDSETAQAARVQTSAKIGGHGYVVEARIDLKDGNTGIGAFEGLDYSVNDGTSGARTANFSWAEPTGTGYQTTSRWGVAQLVAATPTPPAQTAPVVTKQPASVSVSLGGTATFTAAATGNPTPTVTWQRQLKGAIVWTTVAGATKPSLSVVSSAGVDGAKYRAVFTNTVGTVASSAATLTIKQVKPVVTVQPKSVSGALASTVSLTAKASGYPTPTVSWQRQLKGASTWTTLAGKTSTTLSVKVSSSINGAKYRAVFRNAAGTATSSSATVTVKAAKPTITGQPVSVKVKAGKLASFHVSVAASPKATYRWYVKLPGSSHWAPAIQGKSSTLYVTATQARNGTQVRVVVTNAKGSVTSSTATLHVTK
ncbi:endo-1,4-beta-xylanase [Cellulomonas alba]|uniref:Beta-xylanase n=1 Tax=Cellulomonas alba TaxID=3053467 RepID=A0ABT7SD69_9CELL|nr:endo-1,4-beta-xylanase [Cellulomonas alba]MDM7854137.1 endo-1,4-beta-xylanase [Cellulomonas alba]